MKPSIQRVFYLNWNWTRRTILKWRRRDGARGRGERLAALKKLLLPTEGLLVTWCQRQALAGDASARAERPTVPVAFFIWGPGRILPVRVTSFSVEETLFSPTLYPLQATVSLGLEVLTPNVFKCRKSLSTDLAVAAYNFTKLQDDALAIAHIAKAAKISGWDAANLTNIMAALTPSAGTWKHATTLRSARPPAARSRRLRPRIPPPKPTRGAPAQANAAPGSPGKPLLGRSRMAFGVWLN